MSTKMNTDRTFDEEVRELTHSRLRATALVFTCVHLISFVFAVSLGQSVRELLELQAVGVAIAVGCFLLSYVPVVERRPRIFALLLLLGTAAYILSLIPRFGLARQDIPGLVLLVLAVGIFFPFNWRLTLVVVALILLAHLTLTVIFFDPRASGFSGVFWSAVAALLAAVGSRMSFRLRQREYCGRRALATEREKSDRLLRNVLPEEIAQRLKEQERTIADAFAEVTVLFADIVGFTPLSSKLTPERLVGILNELFSGFDEIADRYCLEKIKTIGDCYMVAAGVPQPRQDHAVAIARMALEMRSFVESYQAPAGATLNIRIGINTGPVVAGVIGLKRFLYDLWGDAVNVASRMESHAEAGTIQVSASTAQLLRAQFVLESRGTIDVKGKGPMETFVLVALDEAFVPEI